MCIRDRLSEHQDEGFLEGYVLTGRHGFFATYEAFGRVVAVSYTHLDVYKRQVLLEGASYLAIFLSAGSAFSIA